MLYRVKVALGVAALLMLIGAAVASRAQAGTFPVYIDAYGNGSGCANLTVWGSLSDFAYTPTCSGSQIQLTGPLVLVHAGTNAGYQVNAPAGIALIGASVSADRIFNVNNDAGWGGGGYWQGGGDEWVNGQTNESDGPFYSSYWGFQLVCGWATCNNYAQIIPHTIALTAEETQGPNLLAVGSNNLWYQAGRYVWNPPGDNWPITLYASDPSGVCSMRATVDGVTTAPPAAMPLTDRFQQCPDPTWTPAGGASVDTNTYVPGSGSFPLELSATNAAGVPSVAGPETIYVDNQPVHVTLSALNDPDPTVWLNHAVLVKMAAAAGPSGIVSEECNLDGLGAHAYAAVGEMINGTGTHALQCEAVNGAIDPQGWGQAGYASLVVKIDETPPTVAFEPVNPANPEQVIVDTSDAQSGVASGSVAMRPAAGGAWQPLSTEFDGRHLLAGFDDTNLRGPYVIQATACDQAGNCATTDKTVTMPMRLATSSAVSFLTIANPLRTKRVRERVRVGWHWQTIRRGHKLKRIKVGGHVKTITVIRQVEQCTSTRVKIGANRWQIRRDCRPPQLQLVSQARVPYGQPVTVHGLLTTGQGVPVGGAPVQILTAPDNGSGQFTPAAGVKTDAGGNWSATLPAGPSRIIQASYAGSATLLPASGQASVATPAEIQLSIRPRVLRWRDATTIAGQLNGGYVPPDGVALRLMVGYPGTHGVPVLAFRTDANGAFSIRWSYHSGRGVITYPFWVATTATESDYPFAAAASRHVAVVFGRDARASSRSTLRRAG